MKSDTLNWLCGLALIGIALFSLFYTPLIIYTVWERNRLTVAHTEAIYPAAKFKAEQLVMLPNGHNGIVVNAYIINGKWAYDVEAATSDNDLVLIHELEENLLR